MGRLNNSVEIIPIDGPSGVPSRQNTRVIHPQHRENLTMSYLGDPYIVPRVKQVRNDIIIIYLMLFVFLTHEINLFAWCYSTWKLMWTKLMLILPKWLIFFKINLRSIQKESGVHFVAW